jgi:hypothetical protein
MSVFSFSRKWHRWFAWGTSAFLLIWTITGVIMILPAGPRPAPAAPVTVTDNLASPAAAVQALQLDAKTPVRGVMLRDLEGAPVWAIIAGGRTRLVDAITSAPVEIDSSRAVRLASAGLGPSWLATNAERLTSPDARYRGALPVWRVQFSNQRHVAFVTLGGDVTFGASLLRVKGMAGQLHSFGVPGLTAARPRLRHGLLWIVSAATLVLLVTGAILLLPTLLRRRPAE